jgi:hypothetical protein
MTNKVNQVVAGIFVCAVSSSVAVSTTANASQSVKDENRSEEVMKAFSREDSKEIAPTSTKALKVIAPATEVAIIPPKGKKRHKIIVGDDFGVFDWWDSLWVKTDPAAKQDKYFS